MSGKQKRKRCIFKLLDPDTGKVALIGLTDRNVQDTIDAIMREGSITKNADKLIQGWLAEGKTPRIELSRNTLSNAQAPHGLRSLAAIFNAIVVKETLPNFDEEKERKCQL